MPNIFIIFVIYAIVCFHFIDISASANVENSSTNDENTNTKWNKIKSDEDKLFTHLFRNYNNLSRPIQNYSDSINVNLMFMLMRLIDMDEKEQVLQIYGWLDYTWTDFKLQWSPKEYGNISRMSLPIEKLWRPDVFLYNAVESNFETGYPTNAIVQNNGNVRWVTPSIFKSSCPLDIKWFPFDEQNCFLEFSTWTYPAQQVDLLTDIEFGFDTSQYVKNGEWELSKYFVVREQVTYACCPNKPYTILRFHLNLRRRTLYYIFNMIFPSLIITMISLLSFVLPPESGDKTAIQIAVLLSICFFFSILSSMLPATSDAVPLLGLFFFSCMLIVSASLCCTVYVLNLHYRSHPMGPFAQALLLHWIPWILRVKHPNGKQLRWASLPSLFALSNNKNMPHINLDDKFTEELVIKYPIMERSSSCSTDQFLPSILQQIQRQLKDLCIGIEEKLNFGEKNETKNKKIEEEWKFAARVLDRIFLYIFFTLISGTIVYWLIRAPYLIA